jgi:hypothetical protein
MKATVIAALLSGKLMGSMTPMSTAPNTRPQITPSMILDISPLLTDRRLVDIRSYTKFSRRPVQIVDSRSGCVNAHVRNSCCKIPITLID